MEIVYQVLQHGHTPRQAAEEFARKWFDKPRDIEWFDEATNIFALVNGVARYEVRNIPAIKYENAASWQIRRMS